MILNPAYDFLKVDYENPNLNGGIVQKVEKFRKSVFYFDLHRSSN